MPLTSSTPRVHRSTFAELSGEQLYALLRLRVDVFVVEQACAYAELDGQDVQPGTEHYWIEIDDHPAATLRTLLAHDGLRIGRVATASVHRGQGYAAALMDTAIAVALSAGVTVIRLEAQVHVQDWYATFGFVSSGAVYLEDGIPHISMVRHESTEASRQE